jgi:hypothetical protein
MPKLLLLKTKCDKKATQENCVTRNKPKRLRLNYLRRNPDAFATGPGSIAGRSARGLRHLHPAWLAMNPDLVIGSAALAASVIALVTSLTSVIWRGSPI